MTADPLDLQPSAAERRRWFDEDFGVPTFVMLATLLRNIDSRRLALNAVQNTLFWPAYRREGEYAKVPEAGRQKILELATLEVVSKVFMAIEDLGRLVVATRRPLRDLWQAILTVEPGRALATFASWRTRDLTQYETLFPFAPPSRYGLTGDDARVLVRYYRENARVVKGLFRFLPRFIARHDFAYNRYKHGMPILTGVQWEPLEEGIDGFVPVQSDPRDLRRTKALLVGPKVMVRLAETARVTIEVSRILIERRLQMAEFGGLVPPVLLRKAATPEGPRYDAFGLGRPDGTFDPDLDRLGRAIVARMESMDIQVQLAHPPKTALEDQLAFYRRPWLLADDATAD